MSTRLAKHCWQRKMFDADDRAWLRKTHGAGVRFNEPMIKHTSFKIGGPADIFVQPESEATLKAILKWSQEKNIPYLLIGSGTNLLVKDGGIRGLVIHLGRLANQVTWEMRRNRIALSAGAGVLTKHLCALALKQGWEGMNFALGIPGTLGGAIMVNAGTVHGAMADIVNSMTVMTAMGNNVKIDRKAMTYEYRSLQLPSEVPAIASAPPILISAELDLAKGDREKIRRQGQQWMRSRSKRQPSWQPSAGCFFKNPVKDMPAGRLIDEAGLKGWQIGKARVSHRHANYIVNLGGASAADVLALKDKVQKTVQSRLGIRLEPEVHIVGEEKDSA